MLHITQGWWIFIHAPGKVGTVVADGQHWVSGSGSDAQALLSTAVGQGVDLGKALNQM